ncbi:DUF2207 family protein [Rhodococcus sp. T7]|uniref:DUF2207 family protein n=1 Tax=Rhodococcus sp. T7 TaxID=627444 RepID=UPI00135AAA71|nr:DUF2207 domain-containing protein [Rhodococcus sp. T7]KAF0958481.1 hypothetical protein MLGJGCBP_08401 [Rhodococcus sp. T7]
MYDNGDEYQPDSGEEIRSVARGRASDAARMRVAVAVLLGVSACTGLLFPLVWGPTSNARGLAAIVGDSFGLAAVAVGLSVVAWGAGRLWSRSAREKLPEPPVRYGPVPGLGPAQTEFVVRKWIGDGAPTATLLHLAEQSVVRLTLVDDGLWQIEGIGTPQRWRQIDPISRVFAEHLGIRSPGGVFVADGSPTSGCAVREGMRAMSDECRSWAAQDDLLVLAVRSWIGRAMACLCTVLAALGFLGVLGPTILGVPFVAFVIGSLGVFAAGTGLRHTPTGRQVWAGAAGFERVLSGRSTTIGSAAVRECFLAAVPYAFAFGVADRWPAQYRRITGRAAPHPDWYPSTTLYDEETGLQWAAKPHN